MAWFTVIDEKVEGPFPVETMKEMVSSGGLPSNCLIWGRGQEEWRSPQHWLSSVDQTLANQAVKVESRPALQTWHFAIDGESKGPMSRAELLHELKNIRDKDEILVWTKGMKAWADLFDFHDLVDELGLNRRSHERAALEGSLVVTSDDGQKIMGHLRTISEGGVGAGGMKNQDLSMGQNVHVEIRSEALGEAFTVKAQVQYVTELGYVGLKFLSIGMEAKTHILEHIKSQRPILAEEEEAA